MHTPNRTNTDARGGSMRTLIAYFSLEGSTAYIAEELARRLGADTLRLRPLEAYHTGGFKKYFWGGKSAVMGEAPELESYDIDPAGYDLVVLGTPVWAGRCTPPLRTFLSQHSLAGKRVAAFAGASGSFPLRAFDRLAELAGTPLVCTELFRDPRTGKDPAVNEKLDRFVREVS